MRGERLKILIVEDDDDARYGLRVRLSASGYEPITAPNALYARRLAPRELPDIVLLDLGLPDADGMTLLRELRQHPSLEAVPIVVVSAREARLSEAATLEQGAFAFLQKPVENRVLQDTIARAVASLGPPQRIAEVSAPGALAADSRSAPCGH
jgi:two-component system KDP operon response regulator KdpE